MSQLSPSKPPASPRSAFLSHASADAELAQQLCQRLEAQGVRCWIAPRDLTPGNPYSSEIVHGIEGTDALILLATPAAVNSHNVLNELEQAHRLHKTLLTVMIGKPEISRQLSYYIARLHWIEADTPSLESVAARLAQTLHGASAWKRVASRPSMARTFRYGLWRLLVVPALSAAAVLLLAAFGTLHYLRGRLASDYRSLGWVTMDAAEESSGAPIQVQARVWIGNDAALLTDVSLQEAVTVKDGPLQNVRLLGAPSPPATGTGQLLNFAIPADASALAMCLGVPGTKAGELYRVTQKFSIAGSGEASHVSIAPAGPVRVKKEDGSLCGS